MNPVSVIMAIFAVVGAADRIIGNKFGLGREFERGISTLSSMALSMIGMIVLAPYIAEMLNPFFNFVGKYLPIDPSIIPASLFANDMGGAPLATQLAIDPEIGRFNALVVSAIMGCTISFTIPYALEITAKEQQRELVLGLLCGIVTIPVGCFLGGLVDGISMVSLLINLLPLTLLSALLAVGLLKIPNVCVRIFKVIGAAIKILITIGLALGIVKFLT
ncbi:MAG: ethanolamine utilization protein EutH, partial [Clostridia bacterium]|nr:ethanolamine utilization protein EutH [Clostridia bacterium]